MLPDLNEEQKACLERVLLLFNVAEDEHKHYRDRWDRFWAQYHNYSDWKYSWASATQQRDRDWILHDGKREWGADLHIPYVFSTIETILPRMLSSRPRMLWLPEDDLAQANTENMRWLLDQQQERMNYELVLQTTAKTSLILGIGFQKLYWLRETGQSFRLAHPTIRRPDGPEWVKQPYTRVLWDDPWIEDIDPYDVLWDPYGSTLRTSQYLIHRAWRSTAYVVEKLRSGEWDYIDGSQVDESDIAGLGSKSRWDELHMGRRRAQGFGSFEMTAGRDVHEVWEVHGFGEVTTVLDRQIPVRKAPNPAWHGELPFFASRPTEIPGRMVGKSEPEPIEDLVSEMDTLRSQRRDNATLKLQQSFAFDEGAIDPMDVQFGAGRLIPVRPGTGLRDALMPLQVGDIPNSGYMEEDRLRSDIERVTGLSDQTMGASSSSETATGAQLMQAAASSRIQNKTRRMELELIKPAAQQMVLLNQQRIMGNRTIRVPATPMPGQPEATWALRQISPDELMGAWQIEPEGGSTTPENVPQNRQDAGQLGQMFGQHPGVNKRRILLLQLHKMGIRQPEQYLIPDEYIPVETLDILWQQMVDQGAPPDAARRAIEDAVQAGRALAEETPDAQLRQQGAAT